MAKIILLNKPFNVLCQFTDQQQRPTLAHYINTEGVYPAGRLDYDSEGLMILTDDGKLQHQISHPKAKLAKTYWVQVEGIPKDLDLEPIRAGIPLSDGPCRPATINIINQPNIWPRNPPVRIRLNKPTSWLEIIISEGRNRQVRRMTAAIGYPTLRLIRVKIGEWGIDQLQPGESRQITLHSAKTPHRPGKLTSKRRSRL